MEVMSGYMVGPLSNLVSGNTYEFVKVLTNQFQNLHAHTFLHCFCLLRSSHFSSLLFCHKLEFHSFAYRTAMNFNIRWWARSASAFLTYMASHIKIQRIHRLQLTSLARLLFINDNHIWRNDNLSKMDSSVAEALSHDEVWNRCSCVDVEEEVHWYDFLSFKWSLAAINLSVVSLI